MLFIPVIGSYTKGTSPKHTFHKKKKDVTIVLETLTVYNPETRQCDNTPTITASNERIDMDKLRNQEIRWIALSRNLLKRWKGAFHYGDTVQISSGDKEIDGLWIIQDTLHKRYKNRGDLLFHGSVRKLGKWKNVKISKVETPSLTETSDVIQPTLRYEDYAELFK
jgi:hypothetical protein